MAMIPSTPAPSTPATMMPASSPAKQSGAKKSPAVLPHHMYLVVTEAPANKTYAAITEQAIAVFWDMHLDVVRKAGLSPKLAREEELEAANFAQLAKASTSNSAEEVQKYIQLVNEKKQMIYEAGINAVNGSSTTPKRTRSTTGTTRRTKKTKTADPKPTEAIAAAEAGAAAAGAAEAGARMAITTETIDLTTTGVIEAPTSEDIEDTEDIEDIGDIEDSDSEVSTSG
jgi:hypothetical protein